MLHYSNSRYAAALARRLSLALRGLALRPWSILSERRERALSDPATPSCRCYRHSVNAPVTAQIPCFAPMSAADLALRGLLAPTRPCCPARVCACSSDPTWVASLYAYSLHRAVATVNMDAAAVNIMMALVLPSRRPGFGSGHQTQRQRRHATVAKLAVTVPLQKRSPAQFRQCVHTRLARSRPRNPTVHRHLAPANADATSPRAPGRYTRRN